MSITDKKKFQQARRNWNSRLRAWRIDSENRKLFGDAAPKFAELLWIPTASIQFSAKVGSSKDSAKVINQWPSTEIFPVQESPTIRACLSHWQNGVPWEETGIFSQMMAVIRDKGKVDRLKSQEDVLERYRELDKLYEKVAAKKSLSTRSELIPGNFREEGGILVHIGPSGEPFFGKKGHHRLAIAYALKLELIPAQIGVVHSSAIDKLSAYRHTR